MVAQGAEAGGHLIIVGDDGPALAEGAQVLARVEAEAAAQAERPGPLAAVLGPVRLGGVLDQRDAAPPADVQQRGQVGRLAVEVYRQDSPGPRGDAALDLGGVHRVRLGVHVHEHRLGPDVADGPGGGDEGHRDGDHLVPAADARTDQGQVQGGSPAVDGDAVPGSDVGGERLLELRDLRAQDVGAAVGHLLHGPQQL